jgi:hypothetical protein
MMHGENEVLQRPVRWVFKRSHFQADIPTFLKMDMLIMLFVHLFWLLSVSFSTISVANTSLFEWPDSIFSVRKLIPIALARSIAH